LGKAPAGPGPLGLPNLDRLPEAERRAWWADLSRWVDGMRVAYPHLWPERTESVARTRLRPFPPCWKQHTGLVSDLCVLKTWHDGLREGIEWAGGVQGFHEWRVFLDRTAETVQIVARFCMPHHQEASSRNGTLRSPLTALGRGGIE
jgi:hypothetical protein